VNTGKVHIRNDGGFPSVVIVEASRGQAPQTLLDYLQENYLRYVASGH
jgi:hypothetical protein